MMKTRLQLAIFIVHFGLVFVYPYNEYGYQFWGLSSSSAKNNLEEHISIKTLQNKVSESQHVFDAMKNELRKAQNMNIQKRNSYVRSKKNAIRKREMDHQSYNPSSGYSSPEMETETATKVNNTDAERQYIATYGSEKLYSTGWTRVALWESANMLQPKMMELCKKASKAAGRNDSVCYAELDEVGTLRFINTNFPSISSIYAVCCVPEYGHELDDNGEFFTDDDSQDYVDRRNNTHKIFEHDYQNSDEPQHQHNYTHAHRNHSHPHHDHEPHHGLTQIHNITHIDDDTPRVWYLTKGTRDDCVFFLDRYYQEEDKGDTEYILTKEVCGLEPISNTLDW